MANCYSLSPVRTTAPPDRGNGRPVLPFATLRYLGGQGRPVLLLHGIVSIVVEVQDVILLLLVVVGGERCLSLRISQ